MKPAEYLSSLGIEEKSTAFITCIDGVMRNPDICKILQDFSDLNLKELELKVVPQEGLTGFFEKEVLPTELDIYGCKVIIQPAAKVTTMIKRNEETVEINSILQSGGTECRPIITSQYGKTADEFMHKFHRENSLVTELLYMFPAKEEES